MVRRVQVKRTTVGPEDDRPTGRKIGYGRVSTNDQNPELQRQALLRAGVHPDNLHIDTSTPSGMFFFHMIAAMAQWERAMISERTKAGMAVAKAAGKRLGPTPKWTPAVEKKAKADIAAGMSVEQVATRYKISVSLVRKRLPGGEISRLRGVKRKSKRKG